MGSDQRRDLPERALRWWTKVYFQPLPPESDHSFAGQIGYDCSNTIVGSHGSMLPETETQISRARAIGRVAASAVLVGVAYYVGAKVGLVLRLPPATSSVVWPPNSILTATLLLSPRRRWWLYLLAAFPAHLAGELPADFPIPLVLALFVTNCSEALLAAVCVRWLTDAPARLDTLRRMVAFIVGAVLVAPFGSSFLDAAAVNVLHGEPYWLVWRTRFFSNVLTELTVVPAILTAGSGAPGWLRRASPRRRIEAGLLAVSLLAVAFFSLAAHDDLPAIDLNPSHSPLAFLMPFLLWAAVRFGPAGASLSLLTTMLVAIWAGTQGRGPFTKLPAAESVFALQIFLIAVAIPLMCLGALIEERRRVEKALGGRLRFEQFLARLSAAFVHLPSHDIDAAIASWLRSLGEFLRHDRLVVLRLSADGRGLTVSHSWVAPGIEPLPSIIVARDLPWAVERLVREEPLIFSRNRGFSHRAAPDEPALRHAGLRSSLTIPLVASGKVLGGLAFDSIAVERAWPEEKVQRLQLVGEVFANALARKETEDALRASELMKSAILASLSSGVAVLDRTGRVIAVNDTWSRFGNEHKMTAYAGVALGADYLRTCAEVARECTPRSTEVLAQIEEVLNGTRRGFAFEYSCSAPVGERWFALSVVPLNRPEGGAVVSHTEVTERKRAEVQAERSRQELAHFTRVSTMGELTASLAHELRQPLTGIMTNAQAARRFLDVAPLDIVELRNILADIIADDRRAADVIQRLRDMLRKGERRLTLLVNAMDAMAEAPGADRTIVVRTQTDGDAAVHVAVQDAGMGLRDGTQERVFEPFFTTKPTGMGMGLSVSKSIIEAHGGAIWATNNPTRGATFHFSLPEPVKRA